MDERDFAVAQAVLELLARVQPFLYRYDWSRPDCRQEGHLDTGYDCLTAVCCPHCGRHCPAVKSLAPLPGDGFAVFSR